MLRIEQIRAFFSGRNLKADAREMGLSYASLRKIMSGNGNPDYRSLVIMSDYVEARLRLIQGGE